MKSKNLPGKNAVTTFDPSNGGTGIKLKTAKYTLYTMNKLKISDTTGFTCENLTKTFLGAFF